MKVIEHLSKAKEPLISFEIIPPKRGGDIYGILSVLDDIMKYKPPFIDITSHSAEVVYEETPHGIKKRINAIVIATVPSFINSDVGKRFDQPGIVANPNKISLLKIQFDPGGFVIDFPVTS